jgi:hypothetical protein
MASALETLRETVASLTEAEAAKTLGYIKSLRHLMDSPTEEEAAALADLLRGDPSIHVPPNAFQPLPPVKRIRGRGMPASELLVRDRR